MITFIIVFGVFFAFIFQRNILPLIWCIDYLLEYGLNARNSSIVIGHVFFLLIEMLMLLLIIRKVYSLKRIDKIKNNNDKQKVSSNKLIGCICILYIMFLIIFDFNNIPLFMNKGSDSYSLLVEQQKVSTWIKFGILYLVNICLIFLSIKANGKKKIFYFIFFIIAAIIPGKKSDLLNAIFNYTLISYLIKNDYRIKLILLAPLSLIAISFFVYQYQRTTLSTGNIFNIFTNLNNFLVLMYNSSTSYLEEIIEMNGIDYTSIYHNTLGNYSVLRYYLNPFTKILFNIGIQKAIGPFLAFVLYGNIFPNGVNPTLYFEMLFVTNIKNSWVFSLIFLLCIYFIIIKMVKNIIKNHNKSILIVVGSYYMIYNCLFFMIDSLNAIRNLPFIIIPFVLYLIKESVLYRFKTKKG